MKLTGIRTEIFATDVGCDDGQIVPFSLSKRVGGVADVLYDLVMDPSSAPQQQTPLKILTALA